MVARSRRVVRDRPHRAYPKLLVAVRYALEPAALRASGEPVWSALGRITLSVAEAGGRRWPAHTLRENERGAFFMRTGLHPSWAEQPPPPHDTAGDELLQGELVVDFGHYIPHPAEPQVLEVSAALGPYRSNAVRIEVQP